MNLANKISVSRIILIPFFVACIVYSRLDLAFIIFVVATFTDGLDGFIARTRNQKTALGTVLDPIADKLLLTSAFICLAVAPNIPEHLRFPPYVPIIIISRDFFIVLGSVVIYFIKGDLKVSPSVVGKITTFFQMMAIVTILLQFKYSYLVWNTAVIFTLISAVDYLRKGSMLLSENNTNHKHYPK